MDVTIRRPRERPFGAPLGGKAITFPTPPAICVYRLVSRDLARAITAALGRTGASESLTDVKEMENRKPWRHKKNRGVTKKCYGRNRFVADLVEGK